MAEFGINATELSAPQGAGTAPVAPVQEQAVNTSMLPVMGSFVDLIAKGLKQSRKEDADAFKNKVVGEYVKNETTYNNAVSSGQWDAAKAAAMSRANTNKFFASHPEYITEFNEAGKALRGMTETGDTFEALATEKKIRDADVDDARKNGYTFVPGMTKVQQDAQISANKAAGIAKAQMEERYKINAEARAVGGDARAVADWETKRVSNQVINDIAGKNMDAFGAFAQSISSAVRSNKMTPEAAQFELSTRFGQIEATLQSAAGVNPELAGPFRSIFQNLYNVGKQMADPKTASEDLTNQFNAIMTQSKLMIVADPNARAAVATNQLFQNNPSVALATSKAAIDAYARVSQIPIGDKGAYVPQVVNSPEEQEVLNLLKPALDGLKGGKITDKELAGVQAGNSINQILRQTGDFLDRGADAKRLKGLAEFFASPQYGGFVASGKIDAQAQQAAKKTFQLTYEPVIIRGVQEALGATYVTNADGVGAVQTSGMKFKPQEGKVSDLIDIKFSGSGVVFEKKGELAGGIASAQQRDTVNQLNVAQKAVNQLIHMGAHLEGSTDYNKFWENHKHEYFPNVFSAYQNLNIGDVKGGMRYKGGDASKPASWEKVNGR